MKLDVNLPEDQTAIPAAAADAETTGYAGAWTAELRHDPLLSLALAASSTERLELGTGITVAFARSPMITAIAANDVQQLSHGRLLLGLGSQVRAHITNRFSMPWSSPAPRMREYIAALHAIWANWNDGAPLAFQGDFYTHTLMTPYFRPEPNPYGRPKVFLAGVGELMTTVAGELADGFLCHGFTTERYIREVTLPALDRGLARSDRTRSAVEVCLSPFLVTGNNESEFAQARAAVRERIAFYASTPSYRVVLELHGWGELQSELRQMTKDGRWKEMGDLIDDDMLSAFAIVGEPDQIAGMIEQRFGDVIDRLCLIDSSKDAGGDGSALEPARAALRQR